MNSPTFPATGTKKRTILEALIAARGDLVGVDYLMRIGRAAAVHSVISDLRTRNGWHITNTQEQVKEGEHYVTHSSYRLPVEQIPPTS